MEERDGDPSFDGDASIGVVFPLDCEALAEREERDASSAPPPPFRPDPLRYGERTRTATVFASMPWASHALDMHVAAEAFRGMREMHRARARAAVGRAGAVREVRRRRVP